MAVAPKAKKNTTPVAKKTVTPSSRKSVKKSSTKNQKTLQSFFKQSNVNKKEVEAAKSDSHVPQSPNSPSANGEDDLLDFDYFGKSNAKEQSSADIKPKSFSEIEKELNTREDDEFFATLMRVQKENKERKRQLAEREERQKLIELEKQRLNVRSIDRVFEGDAHMTTLQKEGSVEEVHSELPNQWYYTNDLNAANRFGLFSSLPKLSTSQESDLNTRLNIIDEYCNTGIWNVSEEDRAERMFRLLTGSKDQVLIKLPQSSFEADRQTITQSLLQYGIDISFDSFKKQSTQQADAMDISDDETNHFISSGVVKAIKIHLAFLVQILRRECKRANNNGESKTNYLRDIFILSLRVQIEENMRLSISKDTSKGCLSWELYRAVVQLVASHPIQVREQLVFDLFQAFREIYIGNEKIDHNSSVSRLPIAIQCTKFLFDLHCENSVGSALTRLSCYELLRLGFLSDGATKALTEDQKAILLYPTCASDYSDPELSESLHLLGISLEKIFESWTNLVNETVESLLNKQLLPATEKLEKNKTNRAKLEFASHMFSLMEIMVCLSSLNDPSQKIALNTSPNPSVILGHLNNSLHVVKQISLTNMPALSIQSAIVELISVIQLNDHASRPKHPEQRQSTIDKYL